MEQRGDQSIFYGYYVEDSTQFNSIRVLFGTREMIGFSHLFWVFPVVER